jgi:purine-binding chemotaxis protein CheW
MNDALILCMGDEAFAIPARDVREILEMVPVTRVPGAPACLDGVINVRGRIVPLADLRVLFGMACPPADVHTRVVVVELALGGDPVVVAILADAVRDVTAIDPDTVEPPPKVGMRWPVEFVAGIARHRDRFVVVPSLDRIFATIAGGEAPQPLAAVAA